MIFLSFSSGDRYSIVKSCLYHLRNYGYETWYDYHELILGDKKREKNFEKAIETCDYCKCQHKNVGFMENKYVRKMTFLFSIFFNFPQSNIASGL